MRGCTLRLLSQSAVLSVPRKGHQHQAGGAGQEALGRARFHKVAVLEAPGPRPPLHLRCRAVGQLARQRQRQGRLPVEAAALQRFQAELRGPARRGWRFRHRGGGPAEQAQEGPLLGDPLLCRLRARGARAAEDRAAAGGRPLSQLGRAHRHAQVQLQGDRPGGTACGRGGCGRGDRGRHALDRLRLQLQLRLRRFGRGRDGLQQLLAQRFRFGGQFLLADVAHQPAHPHPLIGKPGDPLLPHPLLPHPPVAGDHLARPVALRHPGVVQRHHLPLIVEHR